NDAGKVTSQRLRSSDSYAHRGRRLQLPDLAAGEAELGVEAARLAGAQGTVAPGGGLPSGRGLPGSHRGQNIGVQRVRRPVSRTWGSTGHKRTVRSRADTAATARSKFAGVEPRANLRKATRRAIRHPGTVTLPREFKSSES
ncbi:MAG: hypothetical protein V3S70_01905, partial [Gammaproteobacteria bacterium]